MGVLAGSVTLTGGPATGLAFAPLFEQAGVPGAATLAVAAAMVGIVAGGVMGGPIGTYLVERYGRGGPRRARRATGTLENLAEAQVPTPDVNRAGGRRRRVLRADEAPGGDARRPSAWASWSAAG